MKIIKNSKSENGFDIIPTDGRRIFITFTDHETGYIVVYEKDATDLSSTATYCTLIDPETNKIIDPQTRLTQIDTAEKIEIDESHSLKLVTRRSIDLDTGLEFLHQELFDLNSGHLITSTEHRALSYPLKEDLLAIYLRSLEENKEREKEFQKFLTEEYSQFSEQEKKDYWFILLRSDWRSQNEAGVDPFWIYNAEHYQKWLRHEPEIDMLLDYAVDKLSILDEDKEKIKERLNEIRN